jgi:hypothetical protein
MKRVLLTILVAATTFLTASAQAEQWQGPFTVNKIELIDGGLINLTLLNQQTNQTTYLLYKDTYVRRFTAGDKIELAFRAFTENSQVLDSEMLYKKLPETYQVGTFQIIAINGSKVNLDNMKLK